MTDTSEVDASLVGKLMADAALMAIAVDGVFFDVAKHGASRFVIVSQLAHSDDYMFQGEAYETISYLVKAVALSTTGADVKAAAIRIHTVLQDQSLTATGYGAVMRMQRTERIRYTEIDIDTDLRWQHRGGLYDVMIQPPA